MIIIAKSRMITVVIIYLITLSTVGLEHQSSFSVIAGRSSSGDIPPPGGDGGDSGGGGAAGGMYINYRIPLVIKEGPFAPSMISITGLMETLLIFGFETENFENDTYFLGMGETIVIDPRTEPNLTNSSLIQATGPIQIDVFYQSGQDDYDGSYSYSVLAMSMWGRIHKSPLDNIKARIIAGYNNSEVTITNGNEEKIEVLHFVGDSIEIEVSNDTKIEGNGPIGVLFFNLTQSEGSFVFTAIPSYLLGYEYYLYEPPVTPNLLNVTDSTRILLNNFGEPDIVYYETSEGKTGFVSIEKGEVTELKREELASGEFYTHIFSAFNTSYSVTMVSEFSIDGKKEMAVVQYISPNNMKWAEVFLTSYEFHGEELNAIILTDDSTIAPLVVVEEGIGIDLGNIQTGREGGYFNYSYPGGYGVISINGSMFAYSIVSEANDTKWNSAARLLFPLNLYSYSDNTSSYFPSWYRFPDLNVKELIISPENPTELRRLKVEMVIQNNGTIPSAPFYTTVFVNETLKAHRRIDGLDINATYSLFYDEFQGFGRKVLNISIYVDSLNQIFELNEQNNSHQQMIIIERNWNLIFVAISVGVLIIAFIVFKVSRKTLEKSKERRSRYDLVLSEAEV